VAECDDGGGQDADMISTCRYFLSAPVLILRLNALSIGYISAEYSRMQFRSRKSRVRVLRAGGVNESRFETVLISCYALCDKQRSSRSDIDNVISGDWGEVDKITKCCHILSHSVYNWEMRF